MTSLKLFWDLLAVHDWQYEYANGAVWKRGSEQRDALNRIKRESPAHEKLFDAYEDFANNRRENPPRRPRT
jgi:hypothetical protein